MQNLVQKMEILLMMHFLPALAMILSMWGLIMQGGWSQYGYLVTFTFIYFLLRLHNNDDGGAWCPLQPVSPDKNDQWLGMNLSSSHVISVLETQGRHAHGQGQEYAMAYRVLYWREGMHKWREYRDSLGRTVG